jgi:hypothetical protein
MKERMLKTVCGYWCNYAVRVSDPQDEHYFWAWQEVDEAVHEISTETFDLLCALAYAAPDAQAEAYLAAGPLEDYINTIVDRKDQEEARKVVTTPELNRLLADVWGEISEFKKLIT